MSRTFTIPRRFHAGHSLLGRLISRRISDTHYAEGVFILAFSILFIALVIANYLGWALLQPYMAEESNQLLFWAGQLSLGFLFTLFCCVGFKPKVEITYEERNGLTIKQGSESTFIAQEHIRNVSQISALRFHQHHRKYLVTRAFVGKLPDTLLLINTSTGPYIIGLIEPDQSELMGLLQPQSEKIVFPTLSPTL